MIKKSVNLFFFRCLINLFFMGIIMLNVQGETLNLTLRNSVDSVHNFEKVKWNSHEVAIVICDMWDSHHSITAVRRVNEFAPRLNEVIKSLRDSGATIIHSPSDCMPSYEDHDARKRALAVPEASELPKNISSWCNRIPQEEEASYPIDQSDGGEDEGEFENNQWTESLKSEGRNPGTPWLRQTSVLEISSKDYVASEGEVVWNILKHKKIEHVILAGVHTNMCVLGRPFGLRQMVRCGMNTVLLRDKTDVMYNPKKWPYVSHFTGLDLVIRHIEENVCSTITSDQLIGEEPFRFRHDKRPQLVVVSQSKNVINWKAFARRFFDSDFRVNYVESDTGKGMNDISQSDCLLLVDEVEDKKVNALIETYVVSAKPVIGVGRHCRNFNNIIFGVNASSHKKKASDVKWIKGVENHDLYRGFKSKEWSIDRRSEGLEINQAVVPLFHCKNGSSESADLLAWSFARNDSGRSCATLLSLHENENDECFQRFLFNAVRWATGELIGSQLPIDPDLRRSNEGWAVRGKMQNSKALNFEHWDLRTLIRVPDNLPNLERILKWESVPGSSVYFNGEQLKENQSGHWLIPSKLLKSGDLNLVVVRVSNLEPFKRLPKITSSEDSFELDLKNWQEKYSNDEIDPNFPIPPQFGAPTDLIQEWGQIK